MTTTLPTDPQAIRDCLDTLDDAIGALYEKRKQLVEHLWRVEERQKARKHYTDLVIEAAADVRTTGDAS